MPIVFSENIIGTVLTNVPLGMPQALYNLFTVICVVHFLLLPFLGASIFDDFSKRTWVYFLKLKSEVFDKFLAYKALVEKQFGHQIQKLRTDNGGEYVNNNFTNYCTTQGIQMQHTIPYTPQQNGVVEIKNHTFK